MGRSSDWQKSSSSKSSFANSATQEYISPQVRAKYEAPLMEHFLKEGMELHLSSVSGHNEKQRMNNPETPEIHKAAAGLDIATQSYARGQTRQALEDITAGKTTFERILNPGVIYKAAALPSLQDEKDSSSPLAAFTNEHS